jgi:hypothetical protein
LFQPHKDLATLAEISPAERDYRLNLQSPLWGSDLGDVWTPQSVPARHFTRRVPVHGKGTGKELLEHIVPIPSAPIFGINRKAEYGLALEDRPNLRTIRVLQRPERGTKPIKRIFILHNGLNERDSMRFYYRLADWILKAHFIPSQGAAACIVMPFPGHLNHYSFHGPFSETPLSRYLSDAGELFRQFLRYMVEMRWFLSAALDPDPKPWMVGGDLFPRKTLVGELQKDSDGLYRASRKRLKTARAIRAKGTGRIKAPLKPGLQTSGKQIKESVDVIRSALGRNSDEPLPSLRAHVVGYSLGGFLAQSVFFAWPQVVSSCTTICSGGAIKSLSPTAFAHSEEWQSVLHSLRPELNNSMLQGRLADPRSKNDLPIIKAAGMHLESFGYFERIFDQVFLQEDRGSYKERLSEYGSRMLFVSGGDDPIVRPTNILDASPDEGITMLSVASMSHFLDIDLDPDDREKEQRDFWLPEAGRLLTRAAIHAEEIHIRERQVAEDLRQPPEPLDPGEPKPGKSRPSVPKSLENDESFELALDWVLEAVEDDRGWLFVCRNALPPAFVPARYFDRWGMALHHHDVPVQQYSAGLRRRSHALRDAKERTTLIVPEQLKHWFIDLSARFDPHSDAPSGRMTTDTERRKIWAGFEKLWLPYVRRFEAGSVDEALGEENFEVETLAEAIATSQGVDQRFIQVTDLPDVWIGLRSSGKLMSVSRERRNVNHAAFINGVASLLTADKRDETLKELIEEEDLRVLSISGAEFNPRYRGKVERKPRAVADLLAWTAASLVRSKPAEEPTAS